MSRNGDPVTRGANTPSGALSEQVSLMAFCMNVKIFEDGVEVSTLLLRTRAELALAEQRRAFE
jgi:hypothetical protein